VSEREVHCWCVHLDAPPDRVAALRATLSMEEQVRGAGFRFEPDRRRFIVAHGTLRELLGRYLDVPAERIRYDYNAFGKPELAAEFGGRITFSLSHSAELALVAIADGVEVGIDVERVREGPLAEYAEIARCFFSAAEVDDLRGVPPHLYARAFFSCWTKKEAYVKARGAALANMLDNPVVPVAGWSMFSLQPEPGYVGALAVCDSAPG